jgi:hypothetical protein
MRIQEMGLKIIYFEYFRILQAFVEFEFSLLLNYIVFKTVCFLDSSIYFL